MAQGKSFIYLFRYITASETSVVFEKLNKLDNSQFYWKHIPATSEKNVMH